MIRIYKYLVVSALFALLCSCEADYKPNDLFGNWHENTGDSISLSLNEDMTFIEVIKPHVSRTINRNSDSTMVLTGKWSIEKPLSPECCWNLNLEYQTHNSTGQGDFLSPCPLILFCFLSSRYLFFLSFIGTGQAQRRLP